MGQSLRATLAMLLIFSSLIGLMFWVIPIQPSQQILLWSVRIVSTTVCVGSLSLLIWSTKFKDKAPDYLAKVCPKYFERDGFCFGIGPEVEDNRVLLSFYYQNRYEQPCEGTIWLVPTKVALKDISSLPEFKVTISCDGGEFGRKYCVCGLPLRYKGETILWDVAAQSKYPNGRGKLLRVKDGVRVGSEIRFAAFRQVVRTIGMFMHLHSEKPARLKIKFPEQTFLFEGIGAWEQETFWMPGEDELTFTS
jgi:hypothetical protein